MRGKADAVTVLSVFLVALFAIPARLGVAALGGAGSPALIMGGLLFGWWLYTRAQDGGSSLQPVQRSYLLLLATVLASYIACTTRAVDGDEPSTAQLAVVSMISFGGMLMVAADGPADHARLRVLLRRLVLGASLVAALAIVQFMTGQSWVDRLQIPGLTPNAQLPGVFERGGLNRPLGTATHPIELGVTLTMALPLAFNLALVDRSRSVLRRWTPVGVIVLAAFLCISRSAVIGLIVGTLVIAARWSRQVRLTVAAVVPVLLTLIFMCFHGVLGGLLQLFTGINGDSSAASRTGSYALAESFIQRAPFFGRGLGTFLPQYRILDNQYLLLSIELGLVGLAVVVALLLTGLWCTRDAVRHSTSDDDTQIGQALRATICVGAASMAFFDEFGFPMAASMLFLCLGLSGAHRRLVRGVPVVATTRGRPMVVRRWYACAVGLVITIGAVGYFHQRPGLYWSQADVVLLAPVSARYPNTMTASSDSIISMAGLVSMQVNSADGGPETASDATTLAGQGIRYGTSARLHDSGGQWAHDFDRPVIDVQGVGPTPAVVTSELDRKVAALMRALHERQASDGTLSRDFITAQVAPGRIQIFYLAGQPSRAVLATIVLGLWGTCVGAGLLDRLLLRRASRRPTPTSRAPLTQGATYAR